MKRNRSADKATEPAQSKQGIAFSDERASKLADESLNLSPERIMEGASAKTALLDQILAQQAEFHEVRYWGINE